METVNIINAENTEGRVDVARAVGSTATLMFIYDLAPGQGSSPYHYEFEEEWMLVVEGTVVVRAPDGEHTLERGAMVYFPAWSRRRAQGDEPQRRAGPDTDVSNPRAPAVAVYPDSDTVGVYPTDDEADGMVFRRATSVPWAHGEDGWERAT